MSKEIAKIQFSEEKVKEFLNSLIHLNDENTKEIRELKQEIKRLETKVRVSSGTKMYLAEEQLLIFVEDGIPTEVLFLKNGIVNFVPCAPIKGRFKIGEFK